MIKGKKFLVPGRRLERHCNVFTVLYSHVPTGHAPRLFIQLSHGISIYGITVQSPNLRSRVEIGIHDWWGKTSHHKNKIVSFELVRKTKLYLQHVLWGYSLVLLLKQEQDCKFMKPNDYMGIVLCSFFVLEMKCRTWIGFPICAK